MKVIFNPIYLLGHIPLFVIYIALIVIIMILTIIFVCKELKK